jgi:TPP-dependent pyruvate/acetoin dehydrogenase alpha subunit
MMAESTDAKPAWENPLIPNARLRQMYRSMVRLRTLARALPAGRRDGLGMEACLASTSLDLGPGDLVSDTLTGGVVEFLRGASLGEALRPGKTATRRGPRADCSAAARMPAGLAIAERIWTALGAAAALKAEAAQAKAAAKAAAETAEQPGVVVIYVKPGEVPVALWQKALPFAAKQELPVLFVVLPAARGAAGTGRRLCETSQRYGVPGIPVDTDDAVALYRVAQESIGRARIGGGAALMECVPFVLESASGNRNGTPDGIAGLENYLLQRSVVTKIWMGQEAKSFAKRVAREKTASK